MVLLLSVIQAYAAKTQEQTTGCDRPLESGLGEGSKKERCPEDDEEAVPAQAGHTDPFFVAAVRASSIADRLPGVISPAGRDDTW
ncbi:hypothetical protein [Streptomyces sp. NPDC001307]|uniref:hypothetical protein n=1 Tax=Streptomyces sp. NPDC001307 TaxID=3364560 RepID=UPI003674EFFC